VQQTFTQKFLLMVIAGFAAACLFWVFRHIVQEAFYESSNAGWKDSLHGSTSESRYH
jgi:hypothetical protein